MTKLFLKKFLLSNSISRISIVSLCASSLAILEPVQAEEIFDGTKNSNAEIPEQLANPIAAMKIIPVQINYDSDLGKYDGKRLVANIQPVIPININKEWNLITRTIVPVTYQKDVFSEKST